MSTTKQVISIVSIVAITVCLDHILIGYLIAREMPGSINATTEFRREVKRKLDRLEQCACGS